MYELRPAAAPSERVEPCGKVETMLVLASEVDLNTPDPVVDVFFAVRLEQVPEGTGESEDSDGGVRKEWKNYARIPRSNVEEEFGPQRHRGADED